MTPWSGWSVPQACTLAVVGSPATRALAEELFKSLSPRLGGCGCLLPAPIAFQPRVLPRLIFEPAAFVRDDRCPCLQAAAGQALPGAVTERSSAAQLKAALKEWELPTTGNKAALWQRLQDQVGAGWGG